MAPLTALGRLGHGTTQPPQLPPLPAQLTDVAQVDAGIRQTCAVTHDGTAWGWGAGGSGRLGNGSTRSSLIPTRAQGTF